MITAETKERPILFSGPMVRAIREGRKTQTRRIIKPQPDWIRPAVGADGVAHGYCGSGPNDGISCPYGRPGDVLWVREAWAPLVVGNERDFIYRADHHAGLEKRDGDQKWKPSIHMPRIACRLILEITGVLVERLNEISGDDAVSEGIDSEVADQTMCFRNYLDEQDWFVHWGDGKDWPDAAKESYQSLWELINGPGSWTANPWVWVVEFKVL